MSISKYLTMILILHFYFVQTPPDATFFAAIFVAHTRRINPFATETRVKPVTVFFWVFFEHMLVERCYFCEFQATNVAIVGVFIFNFFTICGATVVNNVSA
jgi:hypothetical protein